MTIFAKRVMSVAEWIPVQERMGALQMAMGGSVELMMLSCDSAERGKETIYIGLPDGSLLAQFEGFSQINQADLPPYMSTLICNETGSAERFPDIAKKRNAAEKRR